MRETRERISAATRISRVTRCAVALAACAVLDLGCDGQMTTAEIGYVLRSKDGRTVVFGESSAPNCAWLVTESQFVYCGGSPFSVSHSGRTAVAMGPAIIGPPDACGWLAILRVDSAGGVKKDSASLGDVIPPDDAVHRIRCDDDRAILEYSRSAEDKPFRYIQVDLSKKESRRVSIAEWGAMPIPIEVKGTVPTGTGDGKQVPEWKAGPTILRQKTDAEGRTAVWVIRDGRQELILHKSLLAVWVDSIYRRLP